MAKERDPKINRVTVYRTLKMLKAGGLVDELDLMHYGGDQHYYETRLKQEHAHVICMRCGKVEEFFGEPLQRLRKQIESHFGFQILLARTEVGGYCSHCQACERAKWRRCATNRGTGSGRPRRARIRKRLKRGTRVAQHLERAGPWSSSIPADIARACPSSRCPSSIGRQPESELIIRDSRVSRAHAPLWWRAASTF